jgi:ligand-binding SRPBCC domain-containing protein
MHILRYSQKLPLSLEECWKFFSSPRNLEIITPEHLGFEIMNDQDLITMYPGQIIHYTIKPLWSIPIQWVTEITHVQKFDYFIDEQRVGPYKLWHHEHRFEPIVNGVLMHDTVYYQLFFGPLGRVLNFLIIKKEVEAIFDYRKSKLENLFGLYSEVDEK